MNIKQAAQKSGISERNIRYYEQAGLITPARNPENDYRQYTEENMRTLKMIRILRSVDMPVEDIRDVLQGKTTLSDAALAQKQRLQDRMQTLKAAADFCGELNETCCSADALDVDACLTRMEAPAQAGWFTGWVQDYTKVAAALSKEQFSFTPDSEVRTPQQVSAALFAYAEQQDLDIVITHESMTPRFTLNGAEYTARVVYTPVMRVPTAHISCQMVGASEADAAVPAPPPQLAARFAQGTARNFAAFDGWGAAGRTGDAELRRRLDYAGQLCRRGYCQECVRFLLVVQPQR